MMIGPYELNQIYCGECSERMSHLPDNSIPFWLTSPPYDGLRTYKGYTFDFEAIAQQLYRVTQPGGVGVWVVGAGHEDFNESLTPFKQAVSFVEDHGFNLLDTMIYYRFFPTWNEDRRTYKQYFEYCFILSKGRPGTFNPLRDVETVQRTERTAVLRRPDGSKKVERYQPNEMTARGNVWWYDNGYMKTTKDKEAFEHPAIFPEALARDHILSWSNPGDLVLDPMAGSGTTLKMAYLTGRKSLGFDISEEYCQIARKRLQMAMSQPALFNPYQPAEKVEPIQLELGQEV